MRYSLFCAMYIILTTISVKENYVFTAIAAFILVFILAFKNIFLEKVISLFWQPQPIPISKYSIHKEVFLSPGLENYVPTLYFDHDISGLTYSGKIRYHTRHFTYQRSETLNFIESIPNITIYTSLKNSNRYIAIKPKNKSIKDEENVIVILLLISAFVLLYNLTI